MKRTINYIIIVCMSLIIFSCTTTQKFTIYGKPGTSIYKPDESHIGTIQNNGKVKVKLDSENYYAFLLSRDANSEKLIPFALNYKNKSYMGKRIIAGTAYMMLGASFAATLTGGIAYIGGDGNIAASFLAAGGGLATLSLAPMCFVNQLSQTPESYKFTYLPSQTTNQNVVFTNYIENGQLKESVKNKIADVNSSEQDNGKNSILTTSTATVKIKSSKSTRTLKDFGSLVEGTYIGEGKLLHGEEIIEDYKYIKVSLRRINKSTVAVNVYDNNEAFFLKSSNYDIKKTKANEYTMSLNGIPSAIIVINNKNDLIYIHPRVNIEGTIYTLEISATRKK